MYYLTYNIDKAFRNCDISCGQITISGRTDTECHQNGPYHAFNKKSSNREWELNKAKEELPLARPYPKRYQRGHVETGSPRVATVGAVVWRSLSCCTIVRRRAGRRYRAPGASLD